MMPEQKTYEERGYQTAPTSLSMPAVHEGRKKREKTQNAAQKPG